MVRALAVLSHRLGPSILPLLEDVVTPYYEQDGIVIYHGDCIDILGSVPRRSVHMILTDPPYGCQWRSNIRKSKFDAIAGDDSTEVSLAGLRLALNAIRFDRHMYVFGRYDLSEFQISKPVELIWDKGQWNGGDLSTPWGNQHEYIQFAVAQRGTARATGGMSARLRRGSVLRFPRPNGNGVTSHPTEKPVGLLRELIESSSRIGETVLDPFAGVGSTLVAAQRESRCAIGIEIDERYCEIAAKRLAQRVLPLEMGA